ncbi:MAG: polyphosphate:AMP phosphotransferase [Labilithrix sp.]|nr:polyphosphate:AMP phosphotransferase [Labilithrix sp.]MCW5815314.1 polyphosphate:AMP phosphotransferase [Labilithrix sp.]
MFESAEMRHEVNQKTYDKDIETLREALLDAQYEMLDDKSFPVIVLVNGVDGAGKGETVNLLQEWLDPRHVRSTAFGAPTEAERLRPPMWRFWSALPPKGKIGVLFGSWYTNPINERVESRTDDRGLDVELEAIRHFEQVLVDDGTVLVKLWFHLSKKAQKKRLKELEADKLTRWRVTKADWASFEKYDRFRRVSAHALRETSTGAAPWLVIDGANEKYRTLTVGRALLAAIRGRLGATPKSKTNGKATGARAMPASAVSMLNTIDTTGLLKNLDYSRALQKDDYKKRLKRAQETLGRLSRHRGMQKHSIVLVFEGMDAGGKGGAIRRITQAIDARMYHVIPIAAPTEEERAQPYLWRFWRQVPRLGRFVIFDRSWYGRVLVERVEGFATEDAWSRAYREINEFEEQLSQSGYVVAKFWLAVTKEEQMKRFKEREATKRKQFKITAEDWRNRKKWDDYVVAASDMIDRTSTAYAPWTTVEANDKYYARVKVLETLTQRLKDTF